MKNKKALSRLKRHRRIRLHVFGEQAKPRLAVRRSLKNLSAQLIDDIQNKTLFFLSTQDKKIKQVCGSAGNIKAAQLFGEAFAAGAKEKGFSKIVFDRAGYLYHGRIKAFADALRKGGLVF